MGEVQKYYSAVAQANLGKETPVRFRMYWSKFGKQWRVRIFSNNQLNGVLLFSEKEFGVFSSFALLNTTLIEWLSENGDR